MVLNIHSGTSAIFELLYLRLYLGLYRRVQVQFVCYADAKFVSLWYINQ